MSFLLDASLAHRPLAHRPSAGMEVLIFGDEALFGAFKLVEKFKSAAVLIEI